MSDKDYGRADEHGVYPRGYRERWKTRHVKLEDLPNREGFRKGREHWSRHTGLGFPALDGILLKGVGRPWDQVYSELVAKIKSDYKDHCWHDLLNRIRWHVDLNPMDVGDGQYVQGSGRPFWGHSRYRTLMVHPVTGILMHPKKDWCKVKFLGIGERRGWWNDHVYHWQNRYFRKMDGIWNEVEIAHVPKRPRRDHASDYLPNGRRRWYRPRDEDWLYKMDLRDAVLRTRIYSDLMHDLARCHGYKKYNGKLVTHQQYQEEVAKALKSNWYAGGLVTPLLGEHYIYAKAAWPISKARMREVGIPENPGLKLPNIVR